MRVKLNLSNYFSIIDFFFLLFICYSFTGNRRCFLRFRAPNRNSKTISAVIDLRIIQTCFAAVVNHVRKPSAEFFYMLGLIELVCNQTVVWIGCGPTGSHLITTVNCHSSFRLPHQHTLSPRGVCSRIPHMRLFRRDSHGPYIAHVYAVYYTIFGNFWVTSCGRSSGKKSILRALASFAAVRKVMLTSW